MLYHCLRRGHNIKTTLGRRFLFDRITKVILFLAFKGLKSQHSLPSKHKTFVQRQSCTNVIQMFLCLLGGHTACMYFSQSLLMQ